MADPIIVDGHSLVMRCIMGSAPEELRLRLPFTGGVYGALNTLRYVLDRPEVDAGRVFVCFDHSPPDRRRRLIPGYKAGRDDMFALANGMHESELPELNPRRFAPFESFDQKQEALEQIWIAWELFRLLGVTCLRYRKREGDDVVGAVCRLQLDAGKRPVIVSGDSDLWQLVHWGAQVWDLRKNELVNPANFTQRAGAPTDCYVLYRALLGGKDGITGARGLGPEKARDLLERAHWYVRLCREPLDQLAALCEYIGRRPKPSVVETRLVAERARLEDTIRGIDLRGSFGPEAALEALGERLRKRPRPDPHEFLRRCRDLGFRSVLQHPTRYTDPFLRKSRRQRRKRP